MQPGLNAPNILRLLGVCVLGGVTYIFLRNNSFAALSEALLPGLSHLVRVPIPLWNKSTPSPITQEINMDKNILVLCTGNSARSQMTEAILRKRLEDKLNIFSAGIEPKEINPLTLRVLQEKGYPTEELRAKSLMEFLGKKTFEHVIFVCDRAERNCPVTFPGTLSRLSWPFEDPAAFEGSEEAKTEKFRSILAAIESKVDEWLKDEEAPIPLGR